MRLNQRARSLLNRKQILRANRGAHNTVKAPRPLLLVLLIVALLSSSACGTGDNEARSSGNPVGPSSTGSQATASIPSGLTMPMRVDDINLRGVINPFGVVRSSLDLASLGHPGIDLPLNTGAPIFAVAAGRIVSVRPSIDSRKRPGDLVKILLTSESTAGSGSAPERRGAGSAGTRFPATGR